MSFTAKHKDQQYGSNAGNRDSSSGYAERWDEREHSQHLRDQATALAEAGNPSSGAASHAERITLSRVGQEHGDDRTGADDEQTYGQHGVCEQVHAESIAQQDHDEADGGGGDGQDEHSLGAPDTVEPGDEDNSWRGKECGVGDELAGGAH